MTRHTIANALSDFLARDQMMNDKEQVPTGDYYNAAFGDFSPFSEFAGRPFHMAADLLGVSPALLSGILAAGADSERAIADATPEGLERAALYEGADALRTASAMYEWEHQAQRINWPGMNNGALADILDGIVPGRVLTDHQWNAVEEAATRVRENGDEED